MFRSSNLLRRSAWPGDQCHVLRRVDRVDIGDLRARTRGDVLGPATDRDLVDVGRVGRRRAGHLVAARDPHRSVGSGCHALRHADVGVREPLERARVGWRHPDQHVGAREPDVAVGADRDPLQAGRAAEAGLVGRVRVGGRNPQDPRADRRPQVAVGPGDDPGGRVRHPRRVEALGGAIGLDPDDRVLAVDRDPHVAVGARRDLVVGADGGRRRQVELTGNRRRRQRRRRGDEHRGRHDSQSETKNSPAHCGGV